jgi:hypothetical protein
MFSIWLIKSQKEAAAIKAIDSYTAFNFVSNGNIALCAKQH